MEKNQKFKSNFQFFPLKFVQVSSILYVFSKFYIFQELFLIFQEFFYFLMKFFL